MCYRHFFTLLFYGFSASYHETSPPFPGPAMLFSTSLSEYRGNESFNTEAFVSQIANSEFELLPEKCNSTLKVDWILNNQKEQYEHSDYPVLNPVLCISLHLITGPVSERLRTVWCWFWILIPNIQAPAYPPPIRPDRIVKTTKIG